MLLDVVVGCYVINCTITIDKPHYLIRERKVYEGFYPVQLRLWALAGSYRPQNGTERIEQIQRRESNQFIVSVHAVFTNII